MWEPSEEDCREDAVHFDSLHTCHVEDAEPPECIRALHGVEMRFTLQHLQTVGSGNDTFKDSTKINSSPAASFQNLD